MTTDFEAHVTRLCSASVRHPRDAYRDIAWDEPDLAVELGDPRWHAQTWDPIATSSWYLDADDETRSDIGLFRAVCVADAGIQFERVLTKGLLELVATLPVGHPAYRYVYHEVAEEAQHTLMFRELIQRSTLRPPSRSEEDQAQLERLGDLGRTSPTLLLLSAVSGEEALDLIQRRTMRDPATHPLLRRVCAVHVADEARHLSFARAYLEQAVPMLTDRERRRLQYQAPFAIRWTIDHVLGMPTEMPGRRAGTTVTLGEQAAAAADEVRRDVAHPIVDLCRRLGILDDRLEPAWVSHHLIAP